MAKKRDIYVMSNRQPVTEGSVSELCGVLDKPALVPWAAKKTVEAVAELWRPDQAYNAKYIEMALNEAKNGWRVNRDTAGDIGTEIHLIVGAYVEGQLKPETVQNLAHRAGLENFIKVTAGWEWLGSEITLISEWCECDGYPSVYCKRDKHTESPLSSCPKLRGYGGTADAIARVNGKVLLIDFKTSNSVQPTYSMQCALYAAATPVGDAAQLAPVWRQIEEARILHFHKELLSWECLERNIEEHKPYIQHFIGCRRWKKRFENKSYSTHGDSIVIATSSPKLAAPEIAPPTPAATVHFA